MHGYLGIEITPDGRYNDRGPQVFQQDANRLPLQIELVEFTVPGKGGIIGTVSAVRIKKRAKLFVQGIADEAACA